MVSTYGPILLIPLTPNSLNQEKEDSLVTMAIIIDWAALLLGTYSKPNSVLSITRTFSFIFPKYPEDGYHYHSSFTVRNWELRKLCNLFKSTHMVRSGPGAMWRSSKSREMWLWTPFPPLTSLWLWTWLVSVGNPYENWSYQFLEYINKFVIN